MVAHSKQWRQQKRDDENEAGDGESEAGLVATVVVTKTVKRGVAIIGQGEIAAPIGRIESSNLAIQIATTTYGEYICNRKNDIL